MLPKVKVHMDFEVALPYQTARQRPKIRLIMV